MANIKELRGRISSVTNIAKITKAMEMVASMKLRKVQARALAFHPYTMEIRGQMSQLAGFVASDAVLPLFAKREVKTTGIFVVTSDRGLCGAYNSNIMQQVTAFMKKVREQHPDRIFKFYVYGRKGYSYLYRRDYDVERFFAEPPLDKAGFPAAKMVVEELVDSFESGKLDEVVVAHTAFESAARFRPKVEPFLPLASAPEAGDENVKRMKLDYILEPNPEAILNLMVPRYLETVVFDAMLSSFASEQAARRMAMKGATDAAGRMGKELRQVYNRARQESITKELLDIVGGASAVS
ncbi:MAG: ATP synthase F1 subunit gamma [Planctomycetota bacterium]|jgi:F-type H+-transporting ATPase subunit gamma